MTSSSLVLAPDVREELFSHAREGAAGPESITGTTKPTESDGPVEVCGVLSGREATRSAAATRVTGVHRVRNVADDPRTTYELDPSGALATIERVEAAGDDVVGFYHSHPETPARPSSTDRAHATWTGYVYLVVSPATDDPVAADELGAWRWTGDRFESLVVTVES